MALIGTIRKNSWILVVMIALGLGGFIIMDVSSAGGVGGQTEFNIGEVNGEPIPWDDFRRAQEALYQNSTIDIYDQREYVWSYKVEEKIIAEEADKVGLAVGDEEMQELLYGANLSPVVLRNFSDPNTGQLNVQVLNEFRSASQAGTLAPQYQRVWDFQFEEVEKTRLQTKLLEMVKKGIYTPTWMAEEIQNEVGSSYDFRYVLVPFGQIDDTEIEITEDDYKAYIEEKRQDFNRDEETRDVAFVSFDVIATPEDSLLIREKMEQFRDEFAAATDDSTFVVNMGSIYQKDYIKKIDIPFFVADTLWSMENGETYGPYLDPHDETYKVTKVLDRRVVADSVRARHILVGVERAEQAQAAVARADSIMEMLSNGAPFDSLASVYSDDQGSKFNGGDLGFVAEARFVKPFNDLLFHSDAVQNKVYRIASEFGIHIVEILDTKFETNEEGIRLASIAEPIIPSQATQDFIYDDVLEFAGQNRTVDALEATVEGDDELTLETAAGIHRNGYAITVLGPGDVSRSIIRWMFDGDTKAGTVAPEVFIVQHPERYYNAQYVVAAMTGVNKPGLPRPDQVMEQIKSEVTNRKKADALAARIAGQNIDQILADNDMAEADTVKNVNLGVQIMNKIGTEPKVMGTAVTMQIGDVSKPIVGRNGVYVIELTKYTPASAAQNMARLRQQGSFTIASAAELELFEALRKNAEIEDNRFTYF